MSTRSLSSSDFHIYILIFITDKFLKVFMSKFLPEFLSFLLIEEQELISYFWTSVYRNTQASFI